MDAASGRNELPIPDAFARPVEERHFALDFSALGHPPANPAVCYRMNPESSDTAPQRARGAIATLEWHPPARRVPAWHLFHVGFFDGSGLVGFALAEPLTPASRALDLSHELGLMEVNQRNAEAAAKDARARERLEYLENSRSWRFTAPLRRLMRAVRRRE